MTTSPSPATLSSEPCRAAARSRTLLGMLAVAFALHEAEEWNIVAWERAHFVPPPGFDETGARTLLVLFAFLAVAFTALSLRFLAPRAALLALLPLYLTVVLGNALTHVFWAFRFRAYVPGVATAALLLIPLCVAVVRDVLRARQLPAATVWTLCALALLQPLGAVAAGDRLSGSQLALQRLGARLAAWLWGPGSQAAW